MRCWGYNGSGQCDVPSGVGDEGNPVMSIAAGVSMTVVALDATDCNNNGIVDSSEIAQGLAEDCNGNGVPDLCDYGVVALETYSGMPTNDERFTIETVHLPLTNDDSIELQVEARGEFAAASEFLYCYLNDTFLGFAFAADGIDCARNVASLSIDRTVWDAAAVDGSRLVTVWASPTVDPAACVNNEVSVTVRYVGIPADCNDNGLWDGCDIGSGSSTDYDGNGIPDDCQTDCDDDGVPDSWSVGEGLVADCNGNAIPDTCDIARRMQARLQRQRPARCV
jgi:hypothetical protein